jgi:hypothetical protein
VKTNCFSWKNNCFERFSLTALQLHVFVFWLFSLMEIGETAKEIGKFPFGFAGK